ncbi:hypothetical protein Sango_1633200 [Sesamum angolense]|uniref:Kinetochore protein SPC25 n=1 Tax=Sesamum angolense TaxID=2727404 RepID=A0AAE2BR73_9LAMI|nr:hypothetical protein Sango_1633200 [Sesamum angolense]
MQGSGKSNMRTRMAEMRLVCEREIPIQQHRIDSLHTLYSNRFDSAKSEAQRTIQLQEKLGTLKGELREEDGLVKALAVKTRKEAKRMAIEESISVMKARVEELKGIVEDQRGRKNEYAAIISQQSEALTACKDKCNQNREHREQIEEAISWYNKVLGFRIECGHGVKFIFSSISPKNPNEEYSFIIRHENEKYTLLNCDPHLSDTKELVYELNKTNGLFKFVRTMREKFQEAVARGITLHGSSLDQDSSIVSVSAPVASVSSDHRYESPLKEKGLQFSESNSKSRKVGKGHIVHSPGSASSLRRSSRLKVTYMNMNRSMNG